MTKKIYIMLMVANLSLPLLAGKQWDKFIHTIRWVMQNKYRNECTKQAKLSQISQTAKNYN